MPAFLRLFYQIARAEGKPRTALDYPRFWEWLVFLRHGFLRFKSIFVLVVIEEAVEAEKPTDQRALDAFLRGLVAARRPRVRYSRTTAQRATPLMKLRRIFFLLVIVTDHFSLLKDLIRTRAKSMTTSFASSRVAICRAFKSPSAGYLALISSTVRL